LSLQNALLADVLYPISKKLIIKNEIIMKDRVKILGIAFMLILGLGACEKTYLEPEQQQPKTESVQEDDTKDMDRPMYQITHGVWKITSFQWRLRENNDHFKEYTFYFLPNGTAVAVHGNIKEEGKWQKTGDVMRLSFGTLKPLRELNNNKWYFYRDGRNKFALKGLSPIDHKSEYVLFERQ
jgi:hypothetical protein